MDHQANRPAGTHPQGRLNVQILENDLIAGPQGALLGRLTDRTDEIAVVAEAERTHTSATAG